MVSLQAGNEMELGRTWILFALAREAAPFKRSFRIRQRIAHVPFRAWRCQSSEFDVVVAETGMGRACTDAVITRLLNEPRILRPAAVVSAGFAGGLKHGLAVGDVIIADEIVDSSANPWPITWEMPHPQSHWIVGRILSGDRFVAEATAKRELAERFGALAVDMESAAVAEHCQAAGIPFGCVRAISDDVHTELSPSLTSILADGRVSITRAMASMSKNPRLAGEFWRLARNSRCAARSLAKVLRTILTTQP